MARAFEFDPTTKRAAFQRQWNLCAHCGEDIRSMWDHAHHVVPNQAGRLGNPPDEFISSADNCVILCDMCHYAVHDSGKYRAAPPERAWQLSRLVGSLRAVTGFLSGAD